MPKDLRCLLDPDAPGCQTSSTGAAADLFRKQTYSADAPPATAPAPPPPPQNGGQEPVQQVLLQAATKPPETIPKPEYIPEVEAGWEKAYDPGGINRQVWLDHLRRNLRPDLTDEQVEAFFESPEGMNYPAMREAMHPQVTMVPGDDPSTPELEGEGSYYLNPIAARHYGEPQGVTLEEGDPAGVYRHEVGHSIAGYPLTVGKRHTLTDVFFNDIQALFPEVGDKEVIADLKEGGIDDHSWRPGEIYANIITTRATLGRLFTADDVKFWRTVDVHGLSPGLLNTYGDLIEAIQRGNSDFSDKEIADRLNRIAKVETTPGPTKGLV